jgi:hypothetical protein
VRPDVDTILAGVERHDYSAHDGSPAFVHRIVLKPKALESRTRLGYTLALIAG